MTTTKKHDKDGETFLISSDQDFDNLDTDSLLDKAEEPSEPTIDPYEDILTGFAGPQIEIHRWMELRELDPYVGSLEQMDPGLVETIHRTVSGEPGRMKQYVGYTQKVKVILEIDPINIIDYSFTAPEKISEVFMTHGDKKVRLFKKGLPEHVLNETTMTVVQVNHSGLLTILFCNTYLNA
jgi:hypothetical protein